MKTKGLNFLEAVKAVKEKRCTCVSSEFAQIVLRPGVYGLLGNYSSYTTFEATDYELIDPIVPTERVEVKRYVVALPDGSTYSDVCMSRIAAEEKAKEIPNTQVIELTGHYERPLPDPEPTEWESELVPGGDDTISPLTEGWSIPIKHIGKRVRITLLED